MIKSSSNMIVYLLSKNWAKLNINTKNLYAQKITFSTFLVEEEASRLESFHHLKLSSWLFETEGLLKWKEMEYLESNGIRSSEICRRINK